MVLNCASELQAEKDTALSVETKLMGLKMLAPNGDGCSEMEDGMGFCCSECGQHFKHRPIEYRRKDFCSQRCLDIYKGTPKGDMRNKGSRATPCGPAWRT